MPLHQPIPSRCLSAINILAVLILTLSSSAQPLRGYRPQDSKFSGEVRAAFTLIDSDAVSRVRAATVNLRTGKDNLAAGTLFKTPDLPSSTAALIATKLSLLETPLTARLYDGRTFPARLVAADQDNDLAYIAIDSADPATLCPIDITDSPNILPAVGKFLATVDPGDTSVSGVGVVSTKPRPIPPASGLLGVMLEDSTGDMPGALVTDVAPNSAAHNAGMHDGDIIIALDGCAITSRIELIDLIRATGPGQIVRIQALRDGQTLDFTATLGSRPFEQSPRAARMARMGGEISVRRLGFQMVIQHDIFLRPNQMGSPLILLDGTPIGINIARASRIETYALPLSLVRDRLASALKSPLPELPPAEPATKPATQPTTQP